MTCYASVPNRFTSASLCDISKFKSLPYSPRSLDSLKQQYQEYKTFIDAITESISAVLKTHTITPEFGNVLLMIREFTKNLGIRWLEMRHTANTCPYCYHPAKSNGSVRGKTKFTCYNVKLHDDGKPHSFNPDTSFEAIVFWYLSTVFSLAYIAMGLTENNIARSLTIPKMIVEEAIKIGARTMNVKRPKIHAPTAVIYIDESGSFFRGALIAARINNEVYIKLATIPVNLDLKLFFEELKRIVTSENVVVITDGKPDYVTLVRETWPDAIHVAQFHEKDVLGQVHVYFRHLGEVYTARIPWDIFITTEVRNSILLPTSVENISHGRSTQIGKYRVTKIMLFKGLVKYPYRQKPGRNPTKRKRKENGCTSENVVERGTELPKVMISSERDVAKADSKKKSRARLIEEIEIKKWREHPIIARVLKKLEPIFHGKHITTNSVENVFSILKPLIYPHRAEKNILDLAKLILFFYPLRSLTWYRLLTEIVKNLPFSRFIDEFRKRRACTRRRKMVEVRRNGVYKIVYVKWYGSQEVKTKRQIIVRAIWKRGSRIYIHAFCLLRNKPRVFLASRIIHIEEVKS